VSEPKRGCLGAAGVIDYNCGGLDSAGYACGTCAASLRTRLAEMEGERERLDAANDELEERLRDSRTTVTQFERDFALLLSGEEIDHTPPRVRAIRDAAKAASARVVEAARAEITAHAEKHERRSKSGDWDEGTKSSARYVASYLRTLLLMLPPEPGK